MAILGSLTALGMLKIQDSLVIHWHHRDHRHHWQPALIFSVLGYKILQRHMHWDTEEKTQDADKSLRHRRLSSHLASVLPHLHNVLAQHNHLSSTLFSATIGHDASHQDSCANTSAGKDPSARALSDDSCQAFAIYLIFPGQTTNDTRIGYLQGRAAWSW